MILLLLVVLVVVLGALFGVQTGIAVEQKNEILELEHTIETMKRERLAREKVNA